MARWLALLALAALAIGAQGCGGASPPEPAPTPATVAPEPTPTATAAPEPSPEPTPEPGALQRLDEGGYRGLITVRGANLTAAAWLDRDRMYVATYGGAILLVDVETGAVRTVLEGLTIPQGLTVLHGRLYVTDMGNACAEMEAFGGSGCRVDLLKMQESAPDALLRLLSRVSTRILSYRIGDDADLSGERVVLDRVMSISRDHSPNGLANDGEYVYAAIGHPEVYVRRGGGGFVVEHADRLAAAGRRTDLMGVVARFRPIPIPGRPGRSRSTPRDSATPTRYRSDRTA